MLILQSDTRLSGDDECPHNKKEMTNLKGYSVMGEKRATAASHTHNIVIMMFRRNRRRAFPPRASAGSHSCSRLLIGAVFSVCRVRLAFFLRDNKIFR